MCLLKSFFLKVVFPDVSSFMSTLAGFLNPWPGAAQLLMCHHLFWGRGGAGDDARRIAGESSFCVGRYGPACRVGRAARAGSEQPNSDDGKGGRSGLGCSDDSVEPRWEPEC